MGEGYQEWEPWGSLKLPNPLGPPSLKYRIMIAMHPIHPVAYALTEAIQNHDRPQCL